MKLALLCFCFLHVAPVCAELVARNDVQTGGNTLMGGRAQLPQDGGFWIQGRQKPLFARRKLFERQRTIVQKPKVVSVPRNDILPSPTTKVEAKPVEPSCSQLKQSCLPQFGCCDQHASCHCRFFNAICFCRRTG